MLGKMLGFLLMEPRFVFDKTPYLSRLDYVWVEGAKKIPTLG